MQRAPPRLRDDVHGASRPAAVLRRELVFEHRHLLHRIEREIRENRLPAPAIVAGRAVDFKPRLPAARSVGGEKILVHEHVALVDRGTIGGVEQRQVRDAAIRQRRRFHLARVEPVAQLRRVRANFAGHSRDRDLRLRAGEVQLKRDLGGGAAFEREVVDARVGESCLYRRDRVGSRDREAVEREIARLVRLRAPLDLGERIDRLDRNPRHRRTRWIEHAALNRRRIGSLRHGDKTSEQEESEESWHGKRSVYESGRDTTRGRRLWNHPQPAATDMRPRARARRGTGHRSAIYLVLQLGDDPPKVGFP